MMYIRISLSLLQVEDLRYERGIDVSHETVRFWWNRFGPLFARGVRKRRNVPQVHYSRWQWQLDEVFVQINGKTQYLWRAVDHEGEVLESLVTKKRDRIAALRFLRKALRRYGWPKALVSDKLRSYGAALKILKSKVPNLSDHWLNNRTENSHQTFRRREGAMLKFRSIKSLQKYSSVQGAIHSHFNHERHLYDRTTFNEQRQQLLLAWKTLFAA